MFGSNRSVRARWAADNPKPVKPATTKTRVAPPNRHGAATAMLEDSDDDAVFVRDQLGHRNIRETLHYAALSDAKRREKAARLRIAPETWK